MSLCPCDSGLSYSECCEPYITGAKHAPTAEALMRSHYTAYVVHAIDYIVDTCYEDKEKINRDGIKEWSENSVWLGFKILSVKGGDPESNAGTVIFESTYEKRGLKYVHHEIAQFIKRSDGRWAFEGGEIVPETVVRARPKVSRNDPCFCGSGKKYRYCCGR